MDFSLLVCLLLLPSPLSLSLLSGWTLNLRNPFLLKGERSFHRREKVSRRPVMCTSPSVFFVWLVIGVFLLCSDSMGTKLGGKPGSKPSGKKPFKPYNSTEKRGKPGAAGEGGNKRHKPSFSKADKGPRKRKSEGGGNYKER